MKETKVINISQLKNKWWMHDDNYVYIGRPGKGVPGSFGNPNPLKKESDRESNLAQYRKYLEKQVKEDPDFRAKVAALHGKTLVCFCKPKACHGDILAEMADRLHEGYTISRAINEFLVEEPNGGIGWSKYKVDATFYDTEEEAEAVKLKFGLVMCGVGWHSRRGLNDKIKERQLTIPREERVTPGVVGHPTGGKVVDLLDVLYEIADQHSESEKNQKRT